MTRHSALFLATFVLALLLLFRAADALLNSLRARTWPAVDAVVIDSGTGWVEHQRANYKSLLSYELHVRYTYEVAGHRYTGSQIRFSPWGTNENFNPFMLSILRRYQVGAQVRAHFNPANPSDCVLEPQFVLADWAFLLGGLASGICCVGYMRRVQAEKTQM